MLQITWPFNGDVLNHRQGVQTKEGLTIEVSGRAPLNTEVTVNGVAARRKGEAFFADVTLTEFVTAITARTSASFEGDAAHTIRVVWDRNSRKRYRIAIDDNVFFLRELWKQQPKNIFDNLYLGILKKVHDAYGTKYSLNCFYETPEKDFNLSMLDERWKGQFQANSDWLRLTWHAYNEFPDRPYEHTSAADTIRDIDLLQSEISRFAGEESWAMPSIVHWGEVEPSILPALYERGVRVLSGYFQRSGGRFVVSYGLEDSFCNAMLNRRLLMHWPSNIVFSRLTEVINLTPLEEVVPCMKRDMADRDTAEILDFLTHEQYFWPFYFNYIPEHAQRLDAAARYATENGYEPVFYHEGFLGL